MAPWRNADLGGLCQLDEVPLVLLNLKDQLWNHLGLARDLALDALLAGLASLLLLARRRAGRRLLGARGRVLNVEAVHMRQEHWPPASRTNSEKVHGPNRD